MKKQENARDRKTREFLSNVVRNMPLENMTDDDLDKWNKNPLGLKDVLSNFSKPLDTGLEWCLENDGTITTSVVSAGITGANFVHYLKHLKHPAHCACLERELRSQNFTPTIGKETHLAILSLRSIGCKEESCDISRIFSEAERRAFAPVSLEAFCYFLKKFKRTTLWCFSEVLVHHECTYKPEPAARKKLLEACFLYAPRLKLGSGGGVVFARLR